jgi:RNA polymerase-binding protein DksA
MARSTKKALAGQAASGSSNGEPATVATKAAKAAKTATKAATETATKTATKAAKTASKTASKTAAKTASKTASRTAKAATRAPAEKASAKKAPAKKAPAKKATAQKAPVASLVVREGESAWTKAELAEVLDELHEQRDHSRGIVTSLDAELNGLMRDSGDGAGQDQADVGASSFERDHELTVLNSERDKLAQIERALGRIDDGTYGVCESCGNPIGKMRLMAFPRATLCLTCKQREERR